MGIHVLRLTFCMDRASSYRGPASLPAPLLAPCFLPPLLTSDLSLPNHQLHARMLVVKRLRMPVTVQMYESICTAVCSMCNSTPLCHYALAPAAHVLFNHSNLEFTANCHHSIACHPAPCKRWQGGHCVAVLGCARTRLRAHGRSMMVVLMAVLM